MAQVQVRGGRIDTQLYAQRLAGFCRLFKLGLQVLLANYFRRAFAEIGERIVDAIRFGSERHFNW